MQLAIVSTFAAAMPVLRRWIEVHRAIGIEHFYLFVDQPGELEACRAIELPGVRWIARDEALAAHWQALPSWPRHGPYVHQVMGRQCLNTDHAMNLARADGIDWLLHIDLDERLHVPPPWPDLKTYLASKQAFDAVSFVNHEGVPEQWHVGNYLDEVTLFKRNFAVLTPVQQQQAIALFGSRFFLAYHNGKSAVNLRGQAHACAGVHEFQPVRRRHEEHAVCLLHYTNCGFNWFHSKFATLGDYEDHWLGSGRIAELFPIMEASRQAVVRGSIHDATALYERELMHQGGLPHSRQSLLETGILVRIGESAPQLI